MTSGQPATFNGRLDRYFHISSRGSTVGREVRGGLVTFFAMAYILVLNPLIIGTVPDSTGQYLGGGTEPNIAAVAAGTALVAGIMTLFMGAWAKFPMALAAGLGINAMLAYEIVPMPGMTWPAAMGLVVIEGIVILILVLAGFRTAVFNAVPDFLKSAIGVGIGLFIAFIGLVNSRFVTTASGTPTQLGIDGSLKGWPVFVFFFGLLLMIVLMVRKVPGAILISIIVTTFVAAVVQAVGHIGAFDAEKNPLGWSLNVPSADHIIGIPDFATLFKVDLIGGITHIGLLSVVMLVFALLLTDFFDTMGTMVGVAHGAELIDEKGDIPHTDRILIVDSAAAIAGGLGGVSSNTSFVESTSGVAEGARTGLASIVTGLCFLLSIVLSPLVDAVPYEAATPALVVVGFMMMRQISGIDFGNLEIAIPAFLTIITMPFAYSISVGIGLGFVTYALIKLVVGKGRQVNWLLYLIAVLFVVYFLRGLINGSIA